MRQTTLKEIKKGEWFTLKPLEYPKETQVYIKGDYDRGEKKYLCDKWWDCLGDYRILKGSTIVYVDFIF